MHQNFLLESLLRQVSQHLNSPVGITWKSALDIHLNWENGSLVDVSTSVDEGYRWELGCDGYLVHYESTPHLNHDIMRLNHEKLKALLGWAQTRLPFEKVRTALKGTYETTLKKQWDQSLINDHLKPIVDRAWNSVKKFPEIQNHQMEFHLTILEHTYLNTLGAQIHQKWHLIYFDSFVIASDGTGTQKRSFFGPHAWCYQGGLESLDPDYIQARTETLVQEVLELLVAKPCPTQVMDVIIMPDQMLLQIHESVGHPLELDRILKDEINYAGGSFVKLEDFGHLRYGSDHMNVVFGANDPTSFAYIAYDDSGYPNKPTFLIEKGILRNPIGSLESCYRSGWITPVACFRSSSWNRAPIDRMASIDLLPGSFTLEDLISKVELGVLISSNKGWSIDDLRLNFQFSCEYGRMIRDGKLAEVVKNPGYRGHTLEFWRNLQGVANDNHYHRFGSPFCGKGEPNQVIRVSHASAPALVRNVQVYGL